MKTASVLLQKSNNDKTTITSLLQRDKNYTLRQIKIIETNTSQQKECKSNAKVLFKIKDDDWVRCN